MKRKVIDQRGMAALEIILILIVLGVVGFVGYRVYKARQAKPAATTTETKKTDAKAASWSKGGSVVAGKYADADVVKVNDTTYRLYYASQPEGGVLDVYSATSTDGKTWKTESGTRKSMATFPDVVKLSDGRYRMYFQSAGVLKSAISTDGLSFTDEAGTRIDKTNPAGLTLDNVAAPSTYLQSDGSFLMVYRGTINSRYAANTPNPTTQLLLWATSSDGLNWNKKGIAVDTRNSTLNGQLDGPDIVKWDDGTIKVFATSYTGVYQMDYKDGKFTEASLAFAGDAKKTDMGFTGAPPGDPTLAKIGGTWYMYYGDRDGIYYATYQ